MKCPYCNKELEKGTLRSRGGNYFLPDGQKDAKIAFYTQKHLEKANAIGLPPDPYSFNSSVEWPIAYCFRDCKRIIIEYKE